jgi:hypothetical protein
MRVWHDVSTIPDALVPALNELIAFGLDVIAAYEAAIDRIDDREARQCLVALEQGHRRQLDELTACVSLLGGQPRVMGDAKMLVTQARVLFATLRGEREIIDALRVHERTTIKRYDQAVDAWTHRAPPRIAEALLEGLEHARDRHRWLVRHVRSRTH